MEKALPDKAMKLQRLQNTIYWLIVASETSHIFCCVLPAVVSVLSLLAGLGLVSVLPASWVVVHDMLHDWEIPLIILSGIVVLLGWGLHAISRRIDCHDTGCEHGSCKPKKKATNKILKIATILFLANTAIYLVFHRGMDIAVSSSHPPAAIETHKH